MSNLEEDILDVFNAFEIAIVASIDVLKQDVKLREVTTKEGNQNGH